MVTYRQSLSFLLSNVVNHLPAQLEWRIQELVLLALGDLTEDFDLAAKNFVSLTETNGFR